MTIDNVLTGTLKSYRIDLYLQRATHLLETGLGIGRGEGKGEHRLLGWRKWIYVLDIARVANQPIEFLLVDLRERKI